MKKKPIQNSWESLLLRKVSRVIRLCLAISLVTTIQVFATVYAPVQSGDFSGETSGQQAGKKITGKVTDATGAHMPGVYVIIQGTTQGGQNA